MILMTRTTAKIKKKIENELGTGTVFQTHPDMIEEKWLTLHFSIDVAVYYSNDMDYVIIHRGKDFCTIALEEFEDLIIA